MATLPVKTENNDDAKHHYIAQLETENAKLIAYLEAAPKSDKEWLLKTDKYTRRTIEYKEESTILPWAVLFIGITFAGLYFLG